MKRLIIITLFLLTLITIGLEAQPVSGCQYFGFTSRDDYDTQTLFVKSPRTDTAYSNVLWVTKDIGTLRFQLNCTLASTSDSLWVKIYGSADDSTYTQITSPTFTTVTATGSQAVVLTAPPKYIKLQYYVMGASSSFTFSVKAVAKQGY